MKIKLLFLLFAFSLEAVPESIVIAIKRIHLDDYPDAFNPSIIKADCGYLLTFRFCPDRKNDALSFLGIVRLNESFDPISPAQLLDTRFENETIPSQSEDARILSVSGKLYITYNDNPSFAAPSILERRDIFAADLHEACGHYFLAPPVKLQHAIKYAKQKWQKNWMPFDWRGTMLISYSLSPHEVLYPNLETGLSAPIHETDMAFQWKMGAMRGGTPAQLVNGKYLSFFHSSMLSQGKKIYYYYMGACTFSADPPFELLEITPKPIIGKGFYTESSYDKRVIFPCGFVVSGDVIYVSYGKDDREIWIATIDKKRLEALMVPVN